MIAATFTLHAHVYLAIQFRGMAGKNENKKHRAQVVRGKSRKHWVSETFSLTIKSQSLFNVN